MGRLPSLNGWSLSAWGGNVSDLWAEIAAVDSTVTVGIKAPGRARGVFNGNWLVLRRAYDKYVQNLRNHGRLVRRDGLLPAVLLKVPNKAALHALVRLPFIDYIEPPFMANRRSTGITPAGSVWGPNFGAYEDANGNLIPNIYTGMKIPAAWALSSGSGTTVGLIDTGVDTRNPDLTHWQTYKVGADQDYDDHGHGTHQAGAIAAKKNGWHIVGVAHGSSPIGIDYGDVNLPAGINTWRIVASLDTAVAHGARVVNMSFECDDGSDLVSDRLDLYYSGYRQDGSRYDVLFVGAVGSSGDFGDYWVNVAFPARHPAVIAVNAVDYATNDLYPGSHDGSSVELSAYAGMPSTGTAAEGYDDGEAKSSSNASSIVSGIATLVRSQYPHYTNVQTRYRLRYEAVDYGATGRDSEYGYGVVNAYAAVGGFNAVKLIGEHWHDHCYGTDDRTCFLVYETRQCFTETFRAIPKGDGPFTFEWNTGSTSETATIDLCPLPDGGYRYAIEVTVKKPAENNKSITLTGHIQVDPPDELENPH